MKRSSLIQTRTSAISWHPRVFAHEPCACRARCGSICLSRSPGGGSWYHGHGRVVHHWLCISPALKSSSPTSPASASASAEAKSILCNSGYSTIYIYVYTHIHTYYITTGRESIIRKYSFFWQCWRFIVLSRGAASSPRVPHQGESLGSGALAALARHVGFRVLGFGV